MLGIEIKIKVPIEIFNLSQFGWVMWWRVDNWHRNSNIYYTYNIGIKHPDQSYRALISINCQYQKNYKCCAFGQSPENIRNRGTRFFDFFTASVWSRPPGPPKVPGVFLVLTIDRNKGTITLGGVFKKNYTDVRYNKYQNCDVNCPPSTT